MGKRSSFERNPRDYYATPFEAVQPLLGHICMDSAITTFIEPCAGNGALVRHLTRYGLCCPFAFDIEPQESGSIPIGKRDALDTLLPWPIVDLIITNPPWERQLLHQLIEVFRRKATTWLLLDAGWAYTAQAKPYMKFCRKIVVIGRISWMGNGTASKDDCCWYEFIDRETLTTFYP